MRDSSSSNACEDIERINSKGSAYSQAAGCEICGYSNVPLYFMKPDTPKKYQLI
jgi:hypothetical protein